MAIRTSLSLFKIVDTILGRRVASAQRLRRPAPLPLRRDSRGRDPQACRKPDGLPKILIVTEKLLTASMRRFCTTSTSTSQFAATSCSRPCAREPPMRTPMIEQRWRGHPRLHQDLREPREGPSLRLKGCLRCGHRRRRAPTTRRRVDGPKEKLSAEKATDQWSLLAYNGGQRIAHRTIHYMKEHERFTERWRGSFRAGPGPLTLAWGMSDPVARVDVLGGPRALCPGVEAIELPDVAPADRAARSIRRSASCCACAVGWMTAANA